jgi:nitrous oxidase accessory protein
MYSHSNRLEHNRFVSNEVGIFAMYSRDLLVTDNQMLFSRGAAGIGMGMKESGNVTVRGNLLAYNTQGFFLDNSPLVEGDENVFERNVVRLSEVGIGFLSSQHHNVFRRNVLRDNTVQVRVDSGGDALGVTWEGNAWSDYAGYDLDGDGVGDLPYELKDLSGALTARHPDLAYLRGTLALTLLGVAGEVVPLFAPKPILRDPAPRLNLEVGDAN